MILGTLAAAAILSLADPDRAMTHPDLRRKLESIGFGVFIPVFFVTSGVRFDLGALTDSASALAMVPTFLVALMLVRGLPAVLYRDLLDRREMLAAGLLQATSLPFLVAATAIGLELGLLGAGESAALVGAGLLSVLLLPAAGLVLLRRVTNPSARRPLAMHTTCSSYTTEAEAHAAVERLLGEGMPGTRIRVLSGRPEHDHRDEPAGSFAGTAGRVGAFAGAPGSSADAMGSFAGAGDQRRGSFDDADQDRVTTYRDGVRREHIASHRELERLLADAGLDAGAIASDVDALHQGRVLVLVTA